MKFLKYLPVIAAAAVIASGAGIKVYAGQETEYAESAADNASVSDSESDTDEFFYDENGKKYYMSDYNEKGLREIDGEVYYISANGAVKYGWYTVDGVRMYFDTDTGRRVTGWVDYMNERFYSDPVYGKLTGEQTIDGKNYIFDEKGRLNTGWFEYEGSKYYGGDDGEIRTGNCEINGTVYQFSDKGRFKSGWQTSADGKRIYYNYDTEKVIYGWIRYNNYVYYSDEKTGKYTGEHIIDGDIYRFSGEGFMMTGFQKFDDGVRLYYEEGEMAKGLCGYKEKIYFFDEKGLMQTGIQIIEGSRYYFDPDGSMHTGFADIDGGRYYFQDNGVMKTGWLELGAEKYFFRSDGTMMTGFSKIGSDSYYFGSDGVMKTGWQNIKAKKYFFLSNGKMAKGLVKIGSDSYYFGNDGVMKTGCYIVDGERRYFKSDGTMKKFVPKVFVGVGHGGIDSGAVGYIVEKEYTLKTGKLVAQYLEEAGVEYMLSRETDIDTTMEGKLAQCNKYDPDLIIDIHFNAAGGSGFEVYHSMYGGMSLTLAENINGYVSKFMSGLGCQKFIRDGKDRFTIIRETNVPAVLCEGGYVDVWSDAEFIRNNYQKLARAYADGVLKTLDMMFGKD